jgi:4-hydroxyphenylpyruvate dioxygenase
VSTEPAIAPTGAPVPHEDFMPLHGIDHVELWVGNAQQAAFYYRHALASARSPTRGWRRVLRDRTSHVLEQGRIRLVLTAR